MVILQKKFHRLNELEYIQQKRHSFLNRYYNGKITAMISSYLEDDALPTTEIEELRSILTKMSQKGGK